MPINLPPSQDEPGVTLAASSHCSADGPLVEPARGVSVAGSRFRRARTRSSSAARSSAPCSRCCCCARARSSRPIASIDALWGEEPPRTAATSLQNFVSRAAQGCSAPDLARDPGAGLPRCASSRSSSTSAVRAARREAREVEPRASGARAAARGAGALARPPLADFAFEAFAQTEIAPARGASPGRARGADRRPTSSSGATRSSSPSSRRSSREHPLRERLRAS